MLWRDGGITIQALQKATAKKKKVKVKQEVEEMSLPAQKKSKYTEKINEKTRTSSTLMQVSRLRIGRTIVNGS